MKKILIADDDKNIRLLFETELTLEGYQVILASTGYFIKPFGINHLKALIKKSLKEGKGLAIQRKSGNHINQ